MIAILYLYIVAALIASVAVVVCVSLAAVAAVRVAYSRSASFTARQKLESDMEAMVHERYVLSRTKYHVEHIESIESEVESHGE
jgi:hypothetical protein